MVHLRKWLTFLIVATATLVSANDIDRFVQLKDNDISDPSVSSESINLMLQEGIASSNPTIVKLTLQALSNLTLATVRNEDTNGALTLPYREIHKVPKLKEFLINHWNTQHELSGFNAKDQLDKDLAQFSSKGLQFNSTSDGTENSSAEAKLAAILSSVLDRFSPWLTIPQTLSAFWPEDEDVYSLIWTYHKKDQTLEPLAMLRMLNLGQFTTAQANKYRMDRLVAFPVEAGPAADMQISFAARGLALSHPDDAIPNLIRAGLDHIDPRAEVLITLSGYSDEQLDPYYDRLVPLVTVPRRTLPSNREIQEALNRLVPYATNPRSYERLNRKGN